MGTDNLENGFMAIIVFTLHSGQMGTLLYKTRTKEGKLVHTPLRSDGDVMRIISPSTATSSSHSTQVRWGPPRLQGLTTARYMFTLHTGQMGTFVVQLLTILGNFVHTPHRSDGDLITTSGGVLLLIGSHSTQVRWGPAILCGHNGLPECSHSTQVRWGPWDQTDMNPVHRRSHSTQVRWGPTGLSY